MELSPAIADAEHSTSVHSWATAFDEIAVSQSVDRIDLTEHKATDNTPLPIGFDIRGV